MGYVKLPRPVYLCKCGDHAWTSLTQGFVTLVTPEDAHFLEDHAWCAVFSRRRARKVIYVRASKSRSLHRQILSVERGIQIDHENGNGLDNRRGNIRLASNQQNSRNTPKHSDGTSKFKGVSWHQHNQSWRSRIHLDGKRINLGCYRKEEDAARAYDAAALKHFGPYARLNFPCR